MILVQRQSIELPATTVGEWWRRHSLRRHKGGLWTVFFSPATTCYCRVAYNVSLRNVQQDCGGFGGHGSTPSGAFKLARGSRQSHQYRKPRPGHGTAISTGNQDLGTAQPAVPEAVRARHSRLHRKSCPGPLQARRGRHHAVRSCESRDSCFQLPDFLAKVKG